MRDNLLESTRSRNDGAYVIGFLRKTAIAALLMAAAGNVWALGLGQIQVKSKRNQPLVAEIPIISTTPGELAALRARMASPETFRRIGLPPPTGAAADLQFSLGSDAHGRPVIRVTSIRPVDQAVLNFLIEVDWGEGKLVREYSALVDAPNTTSALPQANVQMATVAPSNLVQRPDLPAAAATASEQAPVQSEPAQQPEPVASTPPAPTPASAEGAEGQANAVDVAPPAEAPPPPAPMPAVPVEAAPAPPVAAASSDASQYGPVKRGETLSTIASGLGLRATYSLDQTMLALLQANPDAFVGDNINRLRRGSVLRIPEGGEVARITADEATAVVHQQMQAWRQAQRTVLQPESTPGLTAGNQPSTAAATAASAAAAPSGRIASPAGRPASAPSRRSEARLHIVPPSGNQPATGANTGTGNGGGGSMLQQELAQRDEEIAAKTAEVSELKERVAELERIRNEQRQLLAMKDTELAAAQHRLAAANQATANPATAAAQAPAGEHSDNGMYYLAGGIGGALLVGALVWFMVRRQKLGEPAPVRRRGLDHEALAASMRQIDSKRSSARPQDSTPASSGEKAATPTPTAPVPPAPTSGGRTDAPAWHSGWVMKEPASRQGGAGQNPAAGEEPKATPAVSTAQATAHGSGEGGSEPPARASAEQRFKLVDAFLDMGDRTSAEQLLAELLNDEDDAVSEKAGKMLARIMG